MSIPVKIDHVESIKDSLISFWDDKENYQAFMAALGKELNEIENVCIQLLTERGLFSAKGQQIDDIGALFDIPRNGLTDPAYVSRILQQILVQNSDGTTEALLRGLRLITGSDFVDFFEHPAHVTVWIGDGYQQEIAQNIRDIVAAGVSADIAYDNHFDSFVPAESNPIIGDLQTGLRQDIQATDEFGVSRDIQVTLSSGTPDFRLNSLFAERVDNLGTIPEQSLDHYAPFVERLQGNILISPDELLDPANPDLLAYYNFNEDEGRVEDLSGNSRPILLTDGWERIGSFYEEGSAIAPITPFEGTLTVPDTATYLGADPTKPFTINALINFKNEVPPPSTNQRYTLFSTFNVTELGGWLLEAQPTFDVGLGRVLHILRLTVLTVPPSEESSSIFTIDSETPVSLSVVFDGEGLYLYLNGYSASRITPPFPFFDEIGVSTTKDLSIGKDIDIATFNNSFSALAQIDELRIFKRALTQPELIVASPYIDVLSSLE